MTCSDDAPHSQGCPCWNAKVREDAYAEILKLVEAASADATARASNWHLRGRDDMAQAKDQSACDLDELAVAIRELTEKHRLEAGEAELRNK